MIFLPLFNLFFVLSVYGTSYAPTSSFSETQCTPGKIMTGVTLQAGVDAGKYIEGNDVERDIDCAMQCCSEPQCDVAFLLGSKCFLVICSSARNCSMISAKASSLNPRLIYVTRKNMEGVLRTLFSNDQKEPWNPNICPPMVPLQRVTLKGGISAGEFTDLGPVNSLDECYNICCQKNKCDMAFLLASNCFTISCRNNPNQTDSGCLLETSAESPFNPQAAHVLSRVNPDAGANSDTNLWPNEEGNTIQPTSPSPKYTTMPPNNFLFDPNFNQPQQYPITQGVPFNIFPTTFNNQYFPGFFNSQPYAPMSFEPTVKNTPSESMAPKEIMKGYFMIDANQLAEAAALTPPNHIQDSPDIHVFGKAEENEMGDCQSGPIHIDVSLKRGKKAGIFVKSETPNDNMESCIKACCHMKNSSFNCEVAFMVAGSCYLIDCYDSQSCEETKASSSAYNPKLVYVRKISTTTPETTPTTTTQSVTTKVPVTELEPPKPEPEHESKDTKIEFSAETQHSNCHHDQILWNMSVEGVASHMSEFKSAVTSQTNSAKLLANGVNDMSSCVKLCCQDKKCDAAVLHDGKCMAVSCTDNPRSCVPVTLKSASNKDSQLAFMTRTNTGYQMGIFNRQYILFGAVGLASIALISIVIIATIYSTRKLRQEKKPAFKIRPVKYHNKHKREQEKTRTEEEDEQDRLEELLSRVSASFSKNRSNR